MCHSRCCLALLIVALAPLLFIISLRRLSRRSLAHRRANRADDSKGIKGQKDGFRVHEPLRVAFLHPDLGIGGAERLIVDAAVGLQHIERKPNPMSPNGQLTVGGGNSCGVSRNGSFTGAAGLRLAHAKSNSSGSRSRANSPTTSPPPSSSETGSVPRPRSLSSTTPSLVHNVPAVALRVHRRYDVQMFTNYHDEKRSFEETCDGTLKPPIVMGNWIPRHIANKGHVFFATLRMIAAAVQFVVQYQLRASTAFDVIVVDQIAACMPILKVLAPSLRIYFYCHFPDQLCDPSRMESLNNSIDMMAGRGSAAGAPSKAIQGVSVNITQRIFHIAKHSYRTLFDAIEVAAMRSADRVNYNSRFSRDVTLSVFPFLKATLDDERDILYPPIDLDKALAEPARPAGMPDDIDVRDPRVDAFSALRESFFLRLLTTHRTLTSINRYERKKNISLAVSALAEYARSNDYRATNYLKNATSSVGIPSGRCGSAIPLSESLIEGDCSRSHLPMALVVCGGYDPRLPENVAYHEELTQLCTDSYGDIFRVVESLEVYEQELVAATAPDCPSPSHSTAECPSDSSGSINTERRPIDKIPVIFLRSCTARAKFMLLEHAAAVLYTPEREHFGIVPVEAMLFGAPVVAVNNGGPIESIGVGDVNGFLRPSTPSAFAEGISRALDPTVASEVSMKAILRAKNVFGRATFSEKLAIQLEELAAMSE